MNVESPRVRRAPELDRPRRLRAAADDARDELALVVSILHEIRRERDDLAYEIRIAEYQLDRAERTISALARRLAELEHPQPRLAVAA